MHTADSSGALARALCAALLLCGCRGGLYRAVDVLRSEGVVAPGMKLLSPVSERSPLGVTVKPAGSPEAVELTPERCFYLSEVGATSLDRVRFTDRSASSLAVMVGVHSLAGAGIELARSGVTTGVFTDVTAFSGIGAFDGNRCEAAPGRQFLVVTSALRGTLDIGAAVSVRSTARARLALPGSPLAIQVQAGAARRRKASFSAARPVFFAAASSRVIVTKSSIMPAPISLREARQIDLPAGFSGVVAVMPFDAGNMEATVTVRPDISTPTGAPRDFTGTSCPPHQPTKLAPGAACHVWLGNAVIILKVVMNDATPTIRMEAYRTTLARQ